MKLALNHEVPSKYFFSVKLKCISNDDISLGESWLGLKKLNQLTSEGDYSHRVTLRDFDDKVYEAFYGQFKVTELSSDEDQK